MSQGVNVEQERAWNGPEGESWAANEEWYNAATRYLTPHLFAGAAIQPTDDVLDVGCGCGESTRIAARAGRSALGVDLSGQMIERARGHAVEEGLANVRFERADAQVHAFPASGFDVVISRFGSMFFDDPVAAFANFARALRPSGRIGLLVWREIRRNEWLSLVREALASGRDLPEPPPDAPSALAFSDPDRVTKILTTAGLADVDFDEVEEPVYFGTDAARAFDGLSKQGIVKGLLEGLDDDAKSRALDRLRRVIDDHQRPEGILFGASAWLVRAAKPQRRRSP